MFNSYDIFCMTRRCVSFLSLVLFFAQVSYGAQPTPRRGEPGFWFETLSQPEFLIPIDKFSKFDDGDIRVIVRSEERGKVSWQDFDTGKDIAIQPIDKNDPANKLAEKSHRGDIKIVIDDFGNKYVNVYCGYDDDETGLCISRNNTKNVMHLETRSMDVSIFGNIFYFGNLCINDPRRYGIPVERMYSASGSIVWEKIYLFKGLGIIDSHQIRASEGEFCTDKPIVYAGGPLPGEVGGGDGAVTGMINHKYIYYNFREFLFRVEKMSGNLPKSIDVRARHAYEFSYAIRALDFHNFNLDVKSVVRSFEALHPDVKQEMRIDDSVSSGKYYFFEKTDPYIFFESLDSYLTKRYFKEN